MSCTIKADTIFMKKITFLLFFGVIHCYYYDFAVAQSYPLSREEVGVVEPACPPKSSLPVISSITLSTPGEVLENVRVSGRVSVRAPDVKINCVEVRGAATYSLDCQTKSNCSELTVTNSEFYGDYDEILETSQTSAAILLSGQTNATIQHSIFGQASDALKINGSGNRIDHNYVDCLAASSSGHMDGMQSRSGTDNAFTNNRFSSVSCVWSQNQGNGSAAFFIEAGIHDRILVSGNYFSGAGYTVRLVAAELNNLTFTNNVINVHEVNSIEWDPNFKPDLVETYDGPHYLDALYRNAPSNYRTPQSNCAHWSGNVKNIDSDGDGNLDPWLSEAADDQACILPVYLQEPSICGNDTVEFPEECDGAELSGQTCTSQGFDGGTISCSQSCTLDTSECFSSCGNGVIDQGESCDGGNLGGSTCTSLGFVGGTLGCSSCQHDVSQCEVAPHANLSHYWPMDAITNGLIEDVEGNKDGTVNGSTLVTGKASDALDFDGTDDYVDVGVIDGGSEITIAGWFRADSFGISDARLVSKATGTGEQDHYFMISTLESSGAKLRFRLSTGGSTSTLIGSSPISTGSWIHFTAWYDGSQMRLYQDGLLVGTLAKNGMIDTNATAPVNIGRNPVGGKYFDGSLDDVRIYNRALDQSEIDELAAGLTPGGGGGTPVCGDDVIEAPEQCDGTNLNGQTCQSQGFSSGVLSCGVSCSFETNQCQNAPRALSPPTDFRLSTELQSSAEASKQT